MTAVATPRTPGTGTGAAGPASRRGVARTVLRLHRAALLVWGLAVLGLTGWLVWLTEVTADEARAREEACDRAGRDWCDTTFGVFGFTEPVDWIALLTAHLFLAVAAFAGASLIGRELESGTAHLAWTQGVTPARWLTAKLAVPALAVTAGASALVLVFRWAWAANADLLWGTDWTQSHLFAARGPVTVAYGLCALAVGALTALLLRRALPALGVSVAAVWLLALALADHRASLWPAVHRSSATRVLDPPDTSWVLETGALVHGRRVPNVQFWRCEGAVEARRRCLDDLGVTGFYTTYHPESHFWPLQLVETGVVLAVAALAAVAAFRVLRRRTA
ncbi:hypothetical protein ACH4F6_11885 [Streptomyces sp. NPDC017936]|uniref:hypothetical protein n=1 Tax=Streptomyces sp. NPDC017936 TaxID=3365016 RepID=UPI0037BCADBE